MVKKHKKLISIIIRGKNESRWLKILLKEIKKQSIKNYEIIFCDNNSSDNTLEILKRYKVKKIIKFKKYIPGQILNRAIKKSSGKYICILSAHCIPVNKRWLEEHLEEINKNEKIAAAFGKQIPMPGTSVQNLIDLDIIFKDQPILYNKDPYLNNANSIYKANILKKNLFDPKITNIEDRIWAKKMIKKGFKILYSAKASVFHSHGIHQHNHKSLRAENTYKILVRKYKNIWKKCQFLNLKYFKFALILNGRRIKNIKVLNKKLKNILNQTKNNRIIFDKTILISNLKNKYNKISKLKCKKNLEYDLRYIYRKYKNDWSKINYVVYVNINEYINFKKVYNLVKETIYNNFESSTFGEIVKENFIINFKGIEQFRSTSLESIENKPSITVLKWAKGSVFDVDYLRKGLLFSKKSHIKII